MAVSPMSIRLAVRLGCASLGAALTVSVAMSYIHVPPMTLQKMCDESNHIRLLKVEKLNKEKGVIVFEVTETLKGEQSPITSFKHVIHPDAERVKPIFDWAAVGKTAVMLSAENKPGSPVQGRGYVFIDEYCYTVDFNIPGKYWLMLRAEPELSSRYYGPVDRLREAVKDILDGKEVKAPVKASDVEQDTDRRAKEINEMLQKNRYWREAVSSDEPRAPETNSGNPWPMAAWIIAGVLAGAAAIGFGWRMLYRKRR
jgi:hypothetical protein